MTKPTKPTYTNALWAIKVFEHTLEGRKIASRGASHEPGSPPMTEPTTGPDSPPEDLV